MEIPQRHVTAGLAALALWAAGSASGCAAAQQVKTTRYALAVPDFWEVKKLAAADGEPTVITVGQYGSAVIDEGVGATGRQDANYDRRTADVEVRIYGWPESAAPARPAGAGAEGGQAGQGGGQAPAGVGAQDHAAQLLAGVSDLQLPAHFRIPEQPLECNQFPRKYRVQGRELVAIDLIKRPGFRTIVLGLRGEGSLLGVVARVEFEQDAIRHCHNLRNLQVQLQSLLDGLTLIRNAAAPMPAPAAAPVPGPAAAPVPAPAAAPVPAPAAAPVPAAAPAPGP